MEPEAGLAPEQEEAGPKNFFSRLCGVYFSPKETFELTKKKPDLLLPIIFLIIAGLFSAWYLTKNVDITAGLAEQMEKAVEQGKITPEQAQQQLALGGQFAVVPIIIMGMIGGILAGLLIAAYAKMFSTLSGAENGFKALFSV
ncbi:MAG TPA: YIP1 family protein, partial [Acidobacteriota bacterium]|nr:YIP1 family protein [Acidobacteriota bacterium]